MPVLADPKHEAATSFPETRRAWREFKRTWRSVISIRLLQLASRVAPEGEDRISCLLAVLQHLKRLEAMDRADTRSEL